LRKIPKKVQEFGLHLSLTGPVLGQGNRAIIHQARATGISVRIDKTDPFRRICREARAIVFIDTVGCGPQFAAVMADTGESMDDLADKAE
jgi:hypothetical protein